MTAPAASDVGPAKALLIAVREYLDEHYPHWTFRVGALPDGLRLEMHPRMRVTLMQDRYTWNWPSSDWRDWGPVFGVPVKINPELPEGHWRLVVVTEDVKIGGRLQGA